MINGIPTWVPDTDGGLASYGQNRYNMEGLTGYGGMDNTGSSAIVSNTPSPVANVNAQNTLSGYDFSGVGGITSPTGLANNSYVGKNKYGQMMSFNDSNLGEAQPGSVKTATMDGVTYGGNTDTNQSWTDTIAGWFKPQGPQGTSTGGNILSGIGAGVGAASGLAGMYYSKKNFDLQKDQYDYLKSRDALSDNRTNKFAANVGNGAVS